ncbi:uncharacterized protein METZ01_LOCUS236525, partial [marine metagenome]
AEDPSKNFLPSPGKITKLKIPIISKNIRLDIGVDEGDEITFYYDPMIAKIISKGIDRKESIKNMIQFLKEIEIEGIVSNQSFLLTVLQNDFFVDANYNTKFIENNLNLFSQKKGAVAQTDLGEETDKKLRQEKSTESPQNGLIQNYTEKDLKSFEKIVSMGNTYNTETKTLAKNALGKVYDKPKFLPGGDKYMLIEFGNVMDLEINFTAQNLAQAITNNKVKGVYETAPCFASMLVHYNPDEIKFSDLKIEMNSLLNSLGPSDEIEIESRVFSFPTVYLDKWTQECVKDYIDKIAKKKPDPEFITELNNLDDTDHFVRVHSGTEYWVSSLGFWPGLPFMMPLDPRCKLTAPKYNPPRTWTPKGTVGMGGSSTAIYPEALPGGYQIFGIIPVPIWDTKKSFSVFENNICLFKPGDRVKFKPTDYEEFDLVANKIKDKTFDYSGIIDYEKFSVKNYKAWLSKLDKNKRF